MRLEFYLFHVQGISPTSGTKVFSQWRILKPPVVHVHAADRSNVVNCV